MMKGFTLLLTALAILKPGFVKGALLPELENIEDNDLKTVSPIPNFWQRNNWIPDKDGNVLVYLSSDMYPMEIFVNETFTVADVKTAIFKQEGSPFCPWKVRIYNETRKLVKYTLLKTNVLIKPILEGGDWLYAKCPGCSFEDKDCEKRHKLRVKSIQKNGI